MKYQLILLTVILWSSFTQEIIETSQIDSNKRTVTTQAKSYDIRIYPQTEHLDYLMFPGACSLTQNISSETGLAERGDYFDEEERKLEELRSKVKELAKLSELIKVTKADLQRTTQGGSKQMTMKFSSQDAEMAELQLLESNLRMVNASITAQIGNLSELISHQIDRTNSFDSIRLAFELKISKTRLFYLQSLRDESEDRPSSHFDPQVHSLFGDIEVQITRQKKEITKINDLLKDYSQREQLRLRIANLESQRDGLNMMIKEKESCDEKRGDIFDRQNKKELENIIHDLKKLKMVESQNSNFCQGVSISLEKQLKKILKVYNYSFACAEGLAELRANRLAVEIECQRLMKQQNDIDYDSRNDKLKNYFKNQVELRDQLIQDIYAIKLTQHATDIKQLDKEIQIVRGRVKEIQHQLDNPPPETQNVEMDYERIRNMISDIQKEQNEYCRVKEEYMDKNRKYEVRVRSFEHQAVIARDLRDAKMRKNGELRQLEGRFIEIRSEIIQGLQ